MNKSLPIISFFTALVAGLNACGGSNSSSSSAASSSSGNASSAPAFIEVNVIPWSLASQEGIWRTTFEGYRAALSGAFIGEGQIVTDAYSRGVTVQALQRVSESEVRELNCYELDCTYTQAEFEQRTDFLELESDEHEPLCSGAITERYFTQGNQAYQVAAYCEGEKVANALFEKIVNDPNESLGRVSFNAPSYSAADTNMRVSGYLSRAQIAVVEGEQSGYAFFETMQATIPYDDATLEIMISALGNSQSENFRVFETGRTLRFFEQAVELDGASLLFNAQVISSAFGDSLLGEGLLFIGSGTAEIISASDNAIELIINGTAINGESIELDVNVDFRE